MTEIGTPRNPYTAWVGVADQLADETYVYSLAVFNNNLYGGTQPGGRLFEWNGVDAWVGVAEQLAAQTYINALAVFNNKFYAGTNPGGRLFIFCSCTGVF